MIPVLSAAQNQEADAATISREPISSLDLMERAATRCFERSCELFPDQKKVVVLCGPGNNGGDGLVIARLYHLNGVDVTVYALRFSEWQSDDFRANAERLHSAGLTINEISDQDSIPDLPSDALLIDALFGTGLSRSIKGFAANLIEAINHSGAKVLAVDLPSGLRADVATRQSDAVVKATVTLTFQVPKLALLWPENSVFTGNWQVLNIQLDQGFLDEVETNFYLTEAADIRRILKPRSTFSHKGSFGHVKLVAGSFGKMGAAILSARAVLRSGAGLLTCYVPGVGYPIMQTAVPEAMCLTDEDDYYFTRTDIETEGFTVAVGPGLGTKTDTAVSLYQLLSSTSSGMVLDADALNLIAGFEDMDVVPKGSVLTPHPGEFRRLVGEWADDHERLNKQIALAKHLQSVVVLKGAYTGVASPDGKVYFNPTGNPGMGTAGSGDVLTGIIAAFLAQGHTAIDAARAGVYLHGLSGDLTAKVKGQTSLIASDLIDYLPAAFLTFD